MKIIILTVDQVYANRLTKALISEFTEDIKLIIEPRVLLKNKNFFETIWHYLRISGFNYFYYQSLKMFIYKFLSLLITSFSDNRKSKFYNFHRIAEELRIEARRVFDINSSEIEKTIKRIKPDLIVSLLFTQILSQKFIKISKFGVINFHPAYLPNYKGISPIFWSILNREKYVGYTVHYVDKGIDTGGVIIRRRVEVGLRDTEDLLYQKCVDRGSGDLIKVIKLFQQGTKPVGVKKLGGSYYSFPDKVSVSRYLKKGKRFFDLGEFIWH